MRKTAAFFLILISVSTVLQGQENTTAPDVLLKTAEESFKDALNGDKSYLESISFYCQAAELLKFQPGSLFYNLGNALQLEGKKPEALLSYERALNLSFKKSDIIINRNKLIKEMGLVQHSISIPETLFWAVPVLAGRTLGWLILGILSLLSLMTVVLRLKSTTDGIKIIAFFLYIMTLSLSLSMVTWDKRMDSLAVVFQEDSILRLGDSIMYKEQSELKPGTLLKIIETRKNWCRVAVLFSSETGWIEKSRLMNTENLIVRYK